jgi:hypothetical protein
VSEENDVAHDDWAKMDARLDTSPKIRKAGRNGREVFLFLLRRNRLLAGGGADGRVPASNIEPWYLAEQLMMSEADAVTGVGNAVTAGLIAVSSDFVTICGFSEEWGGKAALSPAEKQKAYRDRQRGQVALPTVTEACNESNALPRREEKRGEENRESGVRAPRRKPSTPMPSGWVPNQTHVDIAAKLGVDMPVEAIKFSDHAAANDKRFVDWDAGFRTWLRNAPTFQRQSSLRVVPANDERDRIRKIPDLGGRRP